MKVVAVTLLSLVSTAAFADDTTAVKIKSLTLNVPSTWKKAPNANSMRLATYAIQAAEGDKEPGELTVFSFGGGGGDVGPNLTRWIGQFASEGRMSKVVKGKAGENDYYVANISGTYNKPDGPPILRKTKPTPGYRMLGVILILKDKGVYYLKMTGPDKTIAAQEKALRAAFGGSAESEAVYDLK